MIKKYLSLVAFSHTLFALPFAIIGFFLGLKDSGFRFDPFLFLKMILCMVFARTSAMAFNRYADRQIDRMNVRTQSREIPSGKISPSSAAFLVVVSSLLFVLTTFAINSICFYLSPAALLVVLGYSYSKRFTSLSHLILGAGLSLAPIGAYLAVTGIFKVLPLFFSFAVLFWVSGFDIIYALQDEEFDRKNQLHSLPARLGKKQALQVSSLLHVISAFFIFLAGDAGHLGILYWSGALLFCLLLFYQHTLVRPDDLSKVNRAFFTTNGFASIVFACFTVSSLVIS